MSEIKATHMPEKFVPEEICDEKVLINFLFRLDYKELGIESLKVVFSEKEYDENGFFTKEFCYN